MGIFCDDQQTDLAAIAHVLRESIKAYESEYAKLTERPHLSIEENGNFEFISVTGTKVLEIIGQFVYPTVLQRVATFLLLCNVSPPFRISAKGVPFLKQKEIRRNFISRFTCLLVYATIPILTVERERNLYALKWTGFPNDAYREQFLMYLQWVEGLQVMPQGRASKQTAQAQFEQIIAHLSIGCAMAMANCVKEEHVRPTDSELVEAKELRSTTDTNRLSL